MIIATRRVIQISGLVTIVLLAASLIGCSKPYPEAYGVYFEDGKTQIPSVNFDEDMYSNINVENLQNTKVNTPLVLWFFDPKIVPTQLTFAHLENDVDSAKPIPFKTIPVEGKAGLFKVEIGQTLDPGYYALYTVNVKDRFEKITDIEWAFTVSIKQSIIFQPGPEGFDTYIGSVYAEGPNGNAQTLSYGGWGDYYYDFFRWDLSSLPPSANVSKVLLYLYFNVTQNDPTFTVKRVTELWDEASLIRSKKPKATAWGTWKKIKNRTGWYSLDITALYKNWKDVTWPNYGIELVPTAINNTNGNIISSDNVVNPKLRPKLVITTQ